MLGGAVSNLWLLIYDYIVTKRNPFGVLLYLSLMVGSVWYLYFFEFHKFCPSAYIAEVNWVIFKSFVAVCYLTYAATVLKHVKTVKEALHDKIDIPFDGLIY